jgi:FkbM family methyltransferase
MNKDIPKEAFLGQKSQDKWVVNEVFPGLTGGCFLDLAAANGILHSNTHVLETFLDWSGLCIEPNPTFFSELKVNRTCQLANIAISDKNEVVAFRIDNGQLGGVVAEDTDNSYSIRGDQLDTAEIIQLEAVNINDLLVKYNMPEYIEYFSLDVEGCEERVISTLNFEKYSFGCITVERPTPEVNRILLQKGYIFVKNYKYDSFYIHPKLQSNISLSCDLFSQIPPKDW